MKTWNKIIATSALASLLMSGTVSANGGYTNAPYSQQKNLQQPHYQTIATPAPHNANNLGYVTPVVNMPNQMPETAPQRSPYQQDVTWWYAEGFLDFELALQYITDQVIEIFYNQLIMQGVMGILQSLMPGWMTGLFDAEAQKAQNINSVSSNLHKLDVATDMNVLAGELAGKNAAMNQQFKRDNERILSHIHTDQNAAIVNGNLNEQCVRASKTVDSLGALGQAENSKAASSYRMRGRFGGGALESIQERSCLFYEMVDQENDYGGVLSGLDLQCTDFNIHTLLQSMGLSGLVAWLSGNNNDHELVDNNVTEAFFRTRTQDQDGKVALVQAAAVSNLFPDDAQQPIQEKRIEDAMAKEDSPQAGLLVSNELREHILAERKLDAKRSIAQNTYVHMMGDSVNYEVNRAEGAGGSKTIFNRFSDLILAPDQADISDTPFGETIQQLEDNPSYKAQLELMAKQLYLHPDYIASATAGGSGEMSKSETLMAHAAESIVLYDTLQSALRHEALLATILEVMTESKQDEVETQARRLNSNN